MNKITKRKAPRPSQANPDYPVNPVSNTQPLVSALLAWFATNARDLPWRRTRDPYAIWVSEIMLQQTQVKTVIPYWERWLRELPTIKSLAHAKADRIHKLWEGLGYYTRVRNMQKAAQQIISGSSRREEAHSQTAIGNRQSAIGNPPKSPPIVSLKFPENFDTVLALPGIGRYTAGAICSIAFNQPTPILDGNVIRVLTRVYGIPTDPREKQTNAQLWQLAEELVKTASEQTDSITNKAREKFLPLPGERAGVRAVVNSKPQDTCSHLNQSLMELGALLCTPRLPNCSACPVQKLCIARNENLQDQLPNLGKRAAATERRYIAFVVERAGKFLVHQRPEGVVNAHLWEFPNVEVGAIAGSARHPGRAAATKTEAGAQQTDATYQPSDFHVTAPKPLCVIKHSITRYRITLEAWRAELAPPSARIPGHWLTPKQLHQLAFTSAHKKILARLGTPIT